MATRTGGSPRRFTIDLKINVAPDQLDGLDGLALERGTTRAAEIRQAIDHHLRAFGVTRAVELSPDERVKALEFLHDIQSRIVAGTAAA